MFFIVQSGAFACFSFGHFGNWVTWKKEGL